MNFDLTLICHKLLVNFSSVRLIFKAKLNMKWTKRYLNVNEYHDNIAIPINLFFVFRLRTM